MTMTDNKSNSNNLYTCVGCMRKYLPDNTQCTACGQDFCPECSTWWNDGSGLEYCYSCRVDDDFEDEVKVVNGRTMSITQ
jgi:hypothetical protein